ncbi:hypothetical protein CEUSTIGMA_g2551.t1 [Chlamydomonas eustigma]|uniref:Uncharacterized protein n=1 Tax=Chlamydomonas eustigma TaxID=1157962 RepID=A0A250WW98_9CHLO|nr:hypothetical protein CEUSTIGMA_g2551.t1 [Chlamydomonas eustigma]|eukprot:GAX75107.1 hypothetical protein CEUSTIGMA_g2551.t1 [Chlamydomonas eustigma]
MHDDNGGGRDRHTPTLQFDIEADDDVLSMRDFNKRYSSKRNRFSTILSSVRDKLNKVYACVEEITLRSGDRNYNDQKDCVEYLARSLVKRGYPVFLRTGPLHTFIVARASPCMHHTEKDMWPTRPAALFKQNDESRDSHTSKDHLIIIDPCFKDHFHVGGSSEEYKQLVHLLPDIFIGTAEDVDSVAKFLCNEVAISFAYMGLPCPHWRTYRSLVGRWLVNEAVDRMVEPS